MSRGDTTLGEFSNLSQKLAEHLKSNTTLDALMDAKLIVQWFHLSGTGKSGLIQRYPLIYEWVLSHVPFNVD